jgi:hypothetical protein
MGEQRRPECITSKKVLVQPSAAMPEGIGEIAGALAGGAAGAGAGDGAGAGAGAGGDMQTISNELFNRGLEQAKDVLNGDMAKIPDACFAVVGGVLGPLVSAFSQKEKDLAGRFTKWFGLTDGDLVMVAVNGTDALAKAHAKTAVDVLFQFVKLIDARVVERVPMPGDVACGGGGGGEVDNLLERLRLPLELKRPASSRAADDVPGFLSGNKKLKEGALARADDPFSGDINAGAWPSFLFPGSSAAASVTPEVLTGVLDRGRPSLVPWVQGSVFWC